MPDERDPPRPFLQALALEILPHVVIEFCLAGRAAFNRMHREKLAKRRAKRETRGHRGGRGPGDDGHV